MNLNFSFLSLLALLALPQLCPAQEATEPVVPLAEEQLRGGGARVFRFREGDRFMPVVFHTAEEAEGRFTDDFMPTLTESVDWDHQYVVVFAWNGPMDDRLTFDVSEGMPPQVTFSLRPGRLRAGSDFNHVYVLRNDAEWDFQELDYNSP